MLHMESIGCQVGRTAHIDGFTLLSLTMQTPLKDCYSLFIRNEYVITHRMLFQISLTGCLVYSTRCLFTTRHAKHIIIQPCKKRCLSSIMLYIYKFNYSNLFLPIFIHLTHWLRVSEYVISSVFMWGPKILQDCTVLFQIILSLQMFFFPSSLICFCHVGVASWTCLLWVGRMADVSVASSLTYIVITDLCMTTLCPVLMSHPSSWWHMTPEMQSKSSSEVAAVGTAPLISTHACTATSNKAAFFFMRRLDW